MFYMLIGHNLAFILQQPMIYRPKYSARLGSMLEILKRAKARLGSGSKVSRLEKLDARKNSARSTPTKNPVKHQI